MSALRQPGYVNRKPTSKQWRQLAEVAEFYYAEKRTQAEIADRLGLSRVKVSRMLTQAMELGVVEFQVHWDSPRDETLERALEVAFPGVQAVVVSGVTSSVPMTIGRFAAAAVEPWLSPGTTVAVSYGRGVYETIRAIPVHHLSDLLVVQLAGVEGANNPAVDGWELVRYCGDRLGARYLHLPAALFSSSSNLHEALLADTHIAGVLGRAANADLAIVGVGSMEVANSSLVRAGHLSAEGLTAAKEAGSVGYICGQHYDASGSPLDELNKYTLSLSLSQLRHIKRVLGVAHGLDKAIPLLGALRGGFLNMVVTDDIAARAILDLNLMPDDPLPP